MKIAFIDNLKVGGGLSRFSYMLCKKMLEYNEDLQIDYYAHEANILRTPELTTLSERLKIKVLYTTQTQVSTFTQRITSKILRKLNLLNETNNDTITEIEERVKDYDLAYFPVAHMMKKPNLDIPIVGTIHDFNWKYFFGSQIFSQAFVQEMDKEIIKWLTTTVTTCSSNDVITEAKKLYPGIIQYPEVIHLAPLVFSENTDEETAQKVLSDLKIDFPYIIFPGNFFPHKNHLNLFSAFSILTKKDKYKDLKLILTGFNSDQVPFGIAEKFGVQLLTQNSPNHYFNVMGLGYQPNYVIEVLIKKAKLLVSPSIYEAICTPGMDAWYFETPTAISNIAPFIEHEEIWGVKPAYFDPMDVNNIAEVIDNCLTDYSTAQSNAAISKKNISNYTWDIVANKYLSVFNKIVINKKC